MADNVEANAGSGGAVFATDDDGTSHHPYVKLEFGANNTQTKVSTSDPLPVVQTGAHAVTVAAAATNIAKAEDAAAASGDVGVPAMVIQLATPADTAGTDGDYAMLQMSAGRVWASVKVDTALPAGANAIGKLAANSGVDIGDVDVTSSALPTGASTSAKQDTAQTSFDAIKTAVEVIDNAIAGSEMQVDIVAALPAGANAIGKLAANSGVDIGDVDVTSLPNVTLAAGTNTNEVVGDAAHDAAAAGNPLRIGAKAETALSGITLVADGDVTDLHAGVDGVLIVREHANLEDVVQERTTNTDGAATAFASGLAAPGAGVRLWITNVDICNSSAVFGTVDLRDGAAGGVLWTLPVPATGGVVKAFDPPLKLTANTALAFDASAAISTITISANGFKSKV